MAANQWLFANTLTQRLGKCKQILTHIDDFGIQTPFERHKKPLIHTHTMHDINRMFTGNSSL